MAALGSLFGINSKGGNPFLLLALNQFLIKNYTQKKNLINKIFSIEYTLEWKFLFLLTSMEIVSIIAHRLKVV